MTVVPVDATFSVTGPEWQVAKPAPAEGTDGQGFGSVLTDAVKGLQADQTKAAEASQALATGQATDQTAAVMALEKARLSMQLASQLRTKATDAISDVMRTQV